MVSAMAVITDKRNAERISDVENALATGRLEGLEPSAEATTIFQQYADGELTLEQMGRAIDEMANRKYGSLRLPRNERT